MAKKQKQMMYIGDGFDLIIEFDNYLKYLNCDHAVSQVCEFGRRQGTLLSGLRALGMSAEEASSLLVTHEKNVAFLTAHYVHQNPKLVSYKPYNPEDDNHKEKSMFG